MHFADVEIEIHHLGNLQNHKLVRGRAGTLSDLQASLLQDWEKTLLSRSEFPQHCICASPGILYPGAFS